MLLLILSYKLAIFLNSYSHHKKPCFIVFLNLSNWKIILEWVPFHWRIGMAILIWFEPPETDWVVSIH